MAYKIWLAGALPEIYPQQSKNNAWEKNAMPLIPDVALQDNTEERVPLVLVLDCSGSMDGAPIAALNQGLQALLADLNADPIAAKRVRILVIALGGNDEIHVSQWQDVMDFTAPVLVANGTTPTGAAVMRALQEIEAQKSELRNAGIPYKRPLLYLMSDGQPTDEWETAASACRTAEAANKLSVFPIAVGDADVSILGAFGNRGSMRLDGLKFKELFLWLSASVKVVSQTTAGQAAQIAPVNSWATVQV
jgi:uncharacterized protein YegL